LTEERYFNQLNEHQVSEFEAPEKDKITNKSLEDYTIHGIRKTWEEARKEKKGAALGVC